MSRHQAGMDEALGFYGWPDRETWFESLQEGDEVMVEGRTPVRSELRKMSVKARTPQGKVRLANGDMYDVWCRIIIGYSYATHIRPVTELEYDEQERQYFLKRLSETDFKKLDLEVLRRLHGLLPGRSRE